MPSSKDNDRIPSAAGQSNTQFNTWDTTDEGNVMNINGNVTMGKPRSPRADKYRGQAPRSDFSRQPLGRQEAHSNSQGPSASQNNVYPPMQQTQNVDHPHRVQSAPPVQNPNQSRFSRSIATPLPYNPARTDELSQYAPPPAGHPAAQYSRPSASANQPSLSTYPSYLPPNTQELPYAPPPAAPPTAQYSRQPSNQPSSFPMHPSYIPQHTRELPYTPPPAPPPTAPSSRPSSNQPSSSFANPSYIPQDTDHLPPAALPTAQELSLLGIEGYLQNTHKTSRSDSATYLRAEEDYVKHILSKMASPTGNSFEKSQRTYASKVSKSVPKICARLFVYQLARIFFDGKADPRTVPFCDKQLQEWGRLDMTACLEKEEEIEEAIKLGYKSELQNEDIVDNITDLDGRATRLRKKLARG